jgi:5-methylcytosine-specific restriction protein B
MNTADRSIALLDTALRRRFSFKEMMPRYDIAPINRKVEGIHLGKLLKAINARIEWMFDRDHQIGHSFLTSVQTLDELDQVMRDKIIPLLTEYFYENWEKVCVALNDKDNQFIKKKKLIAPAMQGSEEEERFRYKVKVKPFPLEAYKTVYQS